MCEPEYSRLRKPIASQCDKVRYLASGIAPDVVGNVTIFARVELEARVRDESLAGQSCEVNSVCADRIGVTSQTAPPVIEEIEAGAQM